MKKVPRWSAAFRRGYQRAYRRANKERLSKMAARRYRKNRAKRLAYQKAYRASHRLVCLAVTSLWKKRNPSRVLVHVQRRRATTKKALQDRHPSEIQAWVDAWRSLPKVSCHWCHCDRKPGDMQIDHMEPLALGGSHTLDNLCICCPPCNQKKGKMPLSKWLKQVGRLQT